MQISYYKSIMLFCTVSFALLMLCCNKPALQTNNRTFRMGFANSAPRLDYNLYMQSLQSWTSRADAAIISGELPWDSLLAGQSPQQYILQNYLPLANYFQNKSLRLWIYLDPENGLNRSSDANALVALGKSIADSDIQVIYTQFAWAMDSMLKPVHLGLAMETNLIRASAPASVYNGVRLASNNAAAYIRSRDKSISLGISIQAETAWGFITGGGYQGVNQDLQDFAFAQEFGISSYPYFNLASPDSIPANYYSRIQEDAQLPVFVSEGGWTSQSITGFSGQLINSSPSVQAAYIARQSKLLDASKALALFQLTYTDIDLSALPPNTPSTIKYFAYIGLLDANMQPKSALNTWDSLYKIPLASGN